MKRKKMTFARFLGKIITLFTWSCVLFIWGTAMFTVFPRMFGKTPYIVLSGSMEPTIPTGAVVYVKEMEEEPQTGDIVAFVAADDVAVIHRIHDLDEESGGYITKGDANDAADGNVLFKEKILGTYSSHIPKIGFLIAELNAHVFYFGNIEVPAIIPILLGFIMILNLLAHSMVRVEEIRIKKKKKSLNSENKKGENYEKNRQH